MAGFFSRARKAVVAFVSTLVGAVWTATLAGTVFRFSPFGINWAIIATAAALAAAAAFAVFRTSNADPNPSI